METLKCNFSFVNHFLILSTLRKQKPKMHCLGAFARIKTNSIVLLSNMSELSFWKPRFDPIHKPCEPDLTTPQIGEKLNTTAVWNLLAEADLDGTG